MKNVKLIFKVIITMPFIMTLFCIFGLAILYRLVGAFLYNLTDFMQYNSMHFDETKETAHELVTMPAQCYEVYKDLIERMKK